MHWRCLLMTLFKSDFSYLASNILREILVDERMFYDSNILQQKNS